MCSDFPDNNRRQSLSWWCDVLIPGRLEVVTSFLTSSLLVWQERQKQKHNTSVLWSLLYEDVQLHNELTHISSKAKGKCGGSEHKRDVDRRHGLDDPRRSWMSALLSMRTFYSQTVDKPVCIITRGPIWRRGRLLLLGSMKNRKGKRDSSRLSRSSSDINSSYFLMAQRECRKRGTVLG